jgi:hypothetical protein
MRLLAKWSERPFIVEYTRLTVVVLSALLIASVVSHALIMQLKIETHFGGHWLAGSKDKTVSVFVAGSSLAGDGISWRLISDALNMRIEGWGVAGSSPAEWEYFQDRATATNLTFIVVSAYDMNEYHLCDFRAEVVPLRQTVADLRECHADWSFSKRLLGLYPLAYLRLIFPTAGRSEGIMVGIREQIKRFVAGHFVARSEAGPTLSWDGSTPGQGYKRERITAWLPGRRLRRLANMQRLQGFNGPKKLAFLRMLEQGNRKGKVIVVVLPVSPMYAKEFLTTDVNEEFERTLREAHGITPLAAWIRLDRINELNSNDYFWDLVHLNRDGQQFATKKMITQLREIGNGI